MGVRFLLGRSGSGKTTAILNEIRKSLEEKQDGRPIIFLVPEQMTFSMEYELAKTPGLHGMVRAQVFSFTRLAWRILQETGGISRQHLSSTGLQMMLRKIIDEEREHFQVYGKASEKSGFIQHIEAMMTEFKRYCITPEGLEEHYKELSGSPFRSEQALADKLHDLVKVYKGMEEELSGKYLDSEDYLRLLAGQTAESAYLEGADVYVDGFYSFTPQEFLVLEALMKKAGSVTVALSADRAFSRHLPHELHLFRMTGMTYHKLSELAAQNGLEMEEPLVLEDLPRYYDSPSLEHLEQNYEARPVRQYSEEGDIVIAQAAGRRSEIEGTAREIERLVKEENFRLRDLAVLVRNSEPYHDLIAQIFQDYEIPYFIDQKRPMLHHPLIELIRSSLETVTENWRYEAVFRAIKTELLYPAGSNKKALREQMDELENYVLSRGIHGNKWTDGNQWIYRRFRNLEGEMPVTDEELEKEQMLNSLKELAAAPLKTLQNRLGRARTGRGKAEALYLFLEELEVPLKLEQLALAAEEKGNLMEAREHSQVWGAVVGLLDEFVEMMDSQKLTNSLFIEMMDTGLESLKFSIVPPALDQVLVADFERSRFYNIKAIFIIGANDGVLPARPSEEGILSEEDREAMARSGMDVAPTAREQLLDENFLIYRALTGSSKKLYLSYPLADEEGKALLPSIVIKRIGEIFPELKYKFYSNEPESLPEEEQLAFISNPPVALTYLAAQLQTWKRGYPVDAVWWDAYNYLVQSDYSRKTRMVLGSLFYQNESKPLKTEVSRKLYGEKIQGSVSRMEMFRSCEFAHFASHGLKLRERQQYKFEAPDMGDLFHAALKMISETLIGQKVPWRSLTKDQCDRLSGDAVGRLAPRLQREILLSSNRHAYIKRKLEKIIARAILILAEHAKASEFSPIGLELGFGRGGELPALRFQLPNGCTMELAGRIDRVDQAESTKGLLLRIIDYKSSDRALNLSEVYYGIALQMLTYLDIVITHSADWLGVKATPAGVLYFHVHDPLVQANSFLSLDKIEEEIFKKFKMKGLLLGDEEAVQMMDLTLDGNASQIISAGFKKGGGFRAGSSIASEEEFSLLRSHVRKEYTKIGTEITDGAIEINPYRLKDKMPCTFCSFRSVCQFDQSLEENNFRILKSKKNDEVLKRLREEGKGDE
ncbi:helicase-exonuclease AddAB subunit AddB [Metabacillus sp. GX 13764]|uniref:helicase-exonuclease AddAB subunit AddB n=1 Tax=Metabacillus kandeliae TaxID=2900151 RepID=UPI001E4C0E78|nr:helicase-exonuclease AddAB subunit AddB [Metabacillus kandeliae]